MVPDLSQIGALGLPCGQLVWCFFSACGGVCFCCFVSVCLQFVFCWQGLVWVLVASLFVWKRLKKSRAHKLIKVLAAHFVLKLRRGVLYFSEKKKKRE